MDRQPNRDRPLIELLELRKLREHRGASFELYVPCLQLYPGDFVAVVGESGCGKSTLLDMLALVLRPTESGAFRFHEPLPDGEFRVFDIADCWQGGDEEALAGLRRDFLGYVLQSGGLLPFLNLEQNIGLPLRVQGRIDPDPDLIREMARAMDIHRVLGQKPQYLSGGQRQRGAILRALIHEPMLVLADEPTAAVDRPRALAIVADLKKLALKQATAVVMVTHDRRLVDEHANRLFEFEIEQVSDNLTRSVVRELS